MAAARVLLSALALSVSSACVVFSPGGSYERTTTRTFEVDETTTVHVRVSGGRIRVTAGEPGKAHITLTARVRASSESDAEAAVRDYDVVLQQQGQDITASARRRRVQDWMFGDNGRVQFRAELEVPPGVALDLDTNGGSITVRGDRVGKLLADTSGGAITVDGGRGELVLNTSGGGITVERALGLLRANTSGGSINVGYVGPTAESVTLDTSGGGIRVGIDREASLRIRAQTSGGGVSIDGFEFDSLSKGKSRADATLNGGRGILAAHTSGGSIRSSRADGLD